MNNEWKRRKELRRLKLGSVILHAYLVVAGIMYGGIYGTTYRTTHKEDGRSQFLWREVSFKFKWMEIKIINNEVDRRSMTIKQEQQKDIELC
eukprot:scaffold2576_cov265-Chaetoceros_neogracile.AAC.5